MIKKILIANRGEIACRIIKTTKKLGLESVAVFSDVDKNAQHVMMADHAVCIDDAKAYLNREKIIGVAKSSKADAIHPGYGFLAEDSQFAQMCLDANIIFIGPSPNAIQSMGDKSFAKNIMKKAGVPTTPGYQGCNDLLKEAEKIGFPVLIKAAKGGGGKGMRLVLKLELFNDLLYEAKAEARASVNDDSVLLEKYIEPARHVEIQVFADQVGNTIYLFDRDCSIQRRHQKIIEEAPAPNIPDEVRKKMGETAVRAAKAIQYTGAGTVEFLVDPEFNFYFMEMNTRLQVEHPVTEMITGLDLVEWQINIANGDPLPLAQNQIQQHGHAIEARICAENPENNFMPSTGELELLHFPEVNKNIRIDSGVIQGDSISPYYDPMIAKLIVWAETRESAITQLKTAFAQTYIIGVENNVGFLSEITQTNDFIHAKLNTQFLENMSFTNKTINHHILALAVIAEEKWREEQSRQLRQKSSDPESPWLERDDWSINQDGPKGFKFWHKKTLIEFKTHSHNIQANWQNDLELIAIVDGESFHAAVKHNTHEIHIFYNGCHYCLQLNNPKATQEPSTSQQNPFTAPMPSQVVEICVKPGQTVQSGDKLMVLEAMKMQHTINATNAGIILTIHYNVGDLLQEGEILLDFKDTH